MTYYLRAALLVLATALPMHALAVNAQGIQSVGEQPTPHHLSPEKARGTVIYGGLGIDNIYTGEVGSSTPWSVGIYARNSNRLVFGFDVGGEGTLKDYTAYRGGAESQSVSLNVLIGRSFLQSEDFIVDTSLLLGLRSAERTCPTGQSFLGYPCYADADPDVKYDLNLGVLVAAAHRAGFTTAFRVTGESVQGLVGINF